MEFMLARVETADLNQRIADLKKLGAANDTLFKEKFQKFMKDSPSGSNPAMDEIRKTQLDE